jgi:hypothetical protein
LDGLSRERSDVILHPNIELTGGDDWQLDATLLDPEGEPIDLSTATVVWTLTNDQGWVVLGESDFTIRLGDEIGQAVVEISAEVTSQIATGLYQDFWRVTANEVTQTLLYGSLVVRADPFQALGEKRVA